jgi:hypothetical protein
MVEKLKRKFIELLETDKEFRYTVERYVDLSEVLRRMDRMEERMLALEERMSKIEERMLKLEENQRRSLEYLKDFEKRLEKQWKYVDSGFKGLREMAGMTLEETVRKLIASLLKVMGYSEASVSVMRFKVDGKEVEVDAFCENPLVVGEITNYIRSRDEAESEVEKLRSRISLVERRYGRRVMLAVLVVATASEEVSSYLREVAGRNGILVVLGREIREKLEA